MNLITISDLLKIVESYNQAEVEYISKTYDFAEKAHCGQYRQSGDAYITHPLNVAYILAEMHADRDTICAALLHDILEDTNITKDLLEEKFNPTIANLVDGVTKLSKMNFTSKEEMQFANTRKIITGIIEDVRIIIIKLADRLHNMRTLEFKSGFKQKENALETMEIFVPLAYYIGAYQIKNELEDLSFKYINPNLYCKIFKIKERLENDGYTYLTEMLNTIHSLLLDNNVPNEIKMRTKNVYGIYKKIESNQTVQDFDILKIHDLYALKVVVDNIEDCYKALYLTHGEFRPLNGRFKDYINSPKTNMYRSLHTTVFGPEGRLVQMQIRTSEMDRIAANGLTALWDINKGEARKVMQEELRNKFQFFKSIQHIDGMTGDNCEFVRKIKNFLLSDMVYVYNAKGEIIELPEGSSVYDFVYKTFGGTDEIIKTYVNDVQVPLNCLLKTKDRVKILK